MRYRDRMQLRFGLFLYEQDSVEPRKWWKKEPAEAEPELSCLIEFDGKWTMGSLAGPWFNNPEEAWKSTVLLLQSRAKEDLDKALHLKMAAEARLTAATQALESGWTQVLPSITVLGKELTLVRRSCEQAGWKEVFYSDGYQIQLIQHKDQGWSYPYGWTQNHGRYPTPELALQSLYAAQTKHYEGLLCDARERLDAYSREVERSRSYKETLQEKLNEFRDLLEQSRAVRGTL
jgi:hypothetical protein